MWGSPLDAMTLVGHGAIRNPISLQLNILLGCSSISLFPISNKYSHNSRNHSLIACHDTPQWSLLRSWACHNAKSGNRTRKSIYHFSPRQSSTKGVLILRWQMIISMQSNKSGLVCPYPILAIFNNHLYMHSSISGNRWHSGLGLFKFGFTQCLLILSLIVDFGTP